MRKSIARWRLREAAQVLNEQLAGEERRDADAQHAAATQPLLEARRDVVELVQQRLDLGAQLDSQVRERELTRAAFEQSDPEAAPRAP